MTNRVHYNGASSLEGYGGAIGIPRPNLWSPASAEERRNKGAVQAMRRNRAHSYTAADEWSYLVQVFYRHAAHLEQAPPINRTLRLDIDVVGLPIVWASGHRLAEKARKKALENLTEFRNHEALRLARKEALARTASAKRRM